MTLADGSWKTLVERSPAVVVVADAALEVRYVNRAAGAPGPIDASAVGRDLLACLPPAQREPLGEAAARVLRGGEAELVRAAGGERGAWFDGHLGSIELDGTRGLVLTLFESSRTQQIEGELEESRAALRGLIENVPGMVYRADANWNVVMAEGVEELCGYSEMELMAEVPWHSLIALEDREKTYVEGSELTERRMSLSQIYRIVTKDGRTRWVEDRKTSAFDEQGSFVGVDGVVFDITERRETEDALLRAKESVIALQEAAISELSTPVFQVWEEIIALPLIGPMDTARAKQFIARLLEAIAERAARVVIVDITGVPVVDTSVARSLMNAVRAARMLGAECALTGVQPNVAQTLVKSGVTLESIVTKGTLEAGLRFAFSRTGHVVRRADAPEPERG